MSVKSIWDSAAFWKRGTRTRAGDGARGKPAFSSRYVGRAKEIGLFTESLKDRRKIVVGISGDDGFGKSTLLATFEQIALEADVVAALATETGEGVARSARTPGPEPRAPRSAARRVRCALPHVSPAAQPARGGSASTEKGLAVLAAGQVARGGLAAGRLIPGVGAGLAFVPEDAVARGAEELASYVLREGRQQGRGQAGAQPRRGVVDGLPPGHAQARAAPRGAVRRRGRRVVP